MIYRLLEEIPNDIDQIVKESLDIIQTYGFVENQIALQNITPDKSDWYRDLGGVVPFKLSQKITHTPACLEDSLIVKYIRKYKGYRSRILKMDPFSCYPTHVDYSPRIHIPIQTNEDAWMIWPELNECHKLTMGSVHWADTTKLHTFINGNKNDRYHLVIATDLFFNDTDQ